MITLETSPELMDPATKQLPMWDTASESQTDTWETTTVRLSDTATMVGTVSQLPNPRHAVRFFRGKGGVAVVVTTDDLIYFGLPGSRIALPDTVVDLPGTFISGKAQKNPLPLTDTPAQTHSRQAMILGAGLATRFEPVSGDTTGYPKPAVPVFGEDSVITLIAKLLKRHGFDRLLINTFYKPECLKAQLSQVDGIEIAYIDEEAPSGTAGGLGKALAMGLVDREKPLVIIQGDAMTDADLSFLMNTHVERQAAVTIGGQVVGDADVHKFGIIETDQSGADKQSGNITSFKEKPSLAEAGPSRFANAGFYYLAPEVLPLFEAEWQRKQAAGQIYDYAQHFFPLVLEAVQRGELVHAGTGKPMAFWAQATGGYWSDIGNPAQYLEAVRDAYGGRMQLPLPSNVSDYFDNAVVYWPGTRKLAQAAGASLEGNVVVARRFTGG